MVHEYCLLINCDCNCEICTKSPKEKVEIAKANNAPKIAVAIMEAEVRTGKTMGELSPKEVFGEGFD